MCPPPDEGIYSLYYRMSFVRLPTAAMGVGIADVATIALLAGCVHAATSPGRLGNLRKAAFGVAVLASLPFVGSVLVLAYHVLAELTPSGWVSKLFTPLEFFKGLVRHAVCGVVILALGAIAATSPAVAAVLATKRLQHVLEPQHLDWRQLRRWAVGAGAVLAAQFVFAAWAIGGYSLSYLLWSLWNGQGVPSLHWQDIFTGALLLAAATLALALPHWFASRSLRLASPSPHTFSEPSRFTTCLASPAQPIPR